MNIVRVQAQFTDASSLARAICPNFPTNRINVNSFCCALLVRQSEWRTVDNVRACQNPFAIVKGLRVVPRIVGPHRVLCWNTAGHAFPRIPVREFSAIGFDQNDF